MRIKELINSVGENKDVSPMPLIITGAVFFAFTAITIAAALNSVPGDVLFPLKSLLGNLGDIIPF